MPELSARLKMAAEEVTPGSVIADIGTDHAYLPVYLLKLGIIKKALACDISKGPLCNAEKTSRFFNVEDRIEMRLSDGFDGISPDEADEFVICGMGGSLIVELIGRTPWLRNGRYRLIIQPQSHSVDVRNCLIGSGFEIQCEKACFDSGRVYNLMVASYTGVIKKYPAYYPWFGSLIDKDDDACREAVKRTLGHLKRRQSAQQKTGNTAEADELEEIIRQAEEKINENR